MPKLRDNELLARADEARDRCDWRAAVELYQRYLKSKPRDFPIWVQLGHALKESGRRVDALVAYSEALGLNENDADLLLSLGHLHKLMGVRDAAIDCYRRSAERDGNVYALYELNGLGAALRPAGAPFSPVPKFPTRGSPLSELWLAFSRWINSIPWLAFIRWVRSVRGQKQRLGDEARDRGNWPAAALHYRQHLEARPGHFAIWVQLGHALKEAGQLDEACFAYDKAFNLNPNDADLLLSFGHVYKLKRDFERARSFYGQCVARGGAPEALAELRLIGSPPAAVVPAERIVPLASDDAARRLAALPRRPLLSIVLPTYDTPQHLLLACLRSVLGQAYPNFELIIVDDGSPHRPTGDRIRALTAGDSRVRIIERPRNGGISAATNDGLLAARGEFTIFMDHDDEIVADSLILIAEHITNFSEIDAWYSDQTKIDEHGTTIDHFYKPDWSPIYMIGVMYIGHMLAVRSDLCRALLFDGRYDGVQDWEFMLRLSEHTQRIGHIPVALYKWRAAPGSLANGTDEKSGIEVLQRTAAQEHLKRIGRSWSVTSSPDLPHRLLIKSGPGAATPKISIIIPSRNQGEVVGRCLDSIFTLTKYPRFEVVLVDNRTTDPLALAAFSRHPIRRTILNEQFNYSKANNIGVAASDGEILLFLNNDTEVLSENWLNDLVLFFEDSGVGAVGPTLLYPNRTVQHAGVVLGARGTADHVMRHFHEGWDGYAGSLVCAREVSAVTAACLMMPRDVFDEVGGFSTDYAKHYQDVDLCLKVRETGRRIIAAGHPRLIHHESVSRKQDGYDMGDRALLIDRWYEQIHSGDPYFNRALDLQRLDYSLAS